MFRAKSITQVGQITAKKPKKSNPSQDKKDAQNQKPGHQKTLSISKQNQVNRQQKILSSLTDKDKTQMMTLADQIGIDFIQEGEDYLEMLYDMVKEDLPVGWVREIAPDNEFMYFNEKKKITTKQHPNIGKFRTQFYDQLETKLEKMPMVYNKNLKQGEPKVLSRWLKGQSNQLSLTGSKDAQDTLGIKKSSNFKISFEQLLQIEKNKGQVTTQNLHEQEDNKPYFEEVLKNLKSIKEDRIDQIDQNRGFSDKAIQELKQQNLFHVNELLNEFKEYYVEKYGDDVKKLKKTVEGLQSYKRIDPDKMVEAIVYLNLQQESNQFYWIARMYISLDLPFNWEMSLDKQGQEVYILSEEKRYKKISIHPCYNYIQHIIQKQKQNILLQSDLERRQNDNKNIYFMFEDTLFREYEINIKQLLDSYIMGNIAFNQELKEQKEKEEEEKLKRIQQQKDDFYYDFKSQIDLEDLQSQKNLINSSQQQQDEDDDDLDSEEEYLRQNPNNRSLINQSIKSIKLDNVITSQNAESQSLLQGLSNQSSRVDLGKLNQLTQNQQQTITQLGEMEMTEEQKEEQERIYQIEQAYLEELGKFQKDGFRSTMIEINSMLIQDRQVLFQQSYHLQRLNQERNIQTEKLEIQKERHNLYKKALEKKKIAFIPQQSVGNSIPSNLTDDHILQLAKIMYLDLPQEAHLIDVIVEYVIWKQEKIGDEWMFRQNFESGQMAYWINHDKSKCVVQYPYYSELMKIISLMKKVIEKEVKSGKIKFKERYLAKMLGILYCRKNRTQQKAMIALRQEAREFLISFLDSDKNRDYIINKFIDLNNQENKVLIQKNIDYKYKDLLDKHSRLAALDQMNEEEKEADQEKKQGNQKDNGKENEKGEQKNEQGYQLKHIMKYLRPDLEYNEEIIKNKLLFNFPFELNINPDLKKKPRNNIFEESIIGDENTDQDFFIDSEAEQNFKSTNNKDNNNKDKSVNSTNHESASENNPTNVSISTSSRSQKMLQKIQNKSKAENTNNKPKNKDEVLKNALKKKEVECPASAMIYNDPKFFKGQFFVDQFDFATSEYESESSDDSLNSLNRAHYKNLSLNQEKEIIIPKATASKVLIFTESSESSESSSSESDSESASSSSLVSEGGETQSETSIQLPQAAKKAEEQQAAQNKQVEKLKEEEQEQEGENGTGGGKRAKNSSIDGVDYQVKVQDSEGEEDFKKFKRNKGKKKSIKSSKFKAIAIKNIDSKQANIQPAVNMEEQAARRGSVQGTTTKFGGSKFFRAAAKVKTVAGLKSAFGVNANAANAKKGSILVLNEEIDFTDDDKGANRNQNLGEMDNKVRRSKKFLTKKLQSKLGKQNTVEKNKLDQMLTDEQLIEETLQEIYEKKDRNKMENESKQKQMLMQYFKDFNIQQSKKKEFIRNFAEELQKLQEKNPQGILKKSIHSIEQEQAIKKDSIDLTSPGFDENRKKKSVQFNENPEDLLDVQNQKESNIQKALRHQMNMLAEQQKELDRVAAEMKEEFEREEEKERKSLEQMEKLERKAKKHKKSKKDKDKEKEKKEKKEKEKKKNKEDNELMNAFFGKIKKTPQSNKDIGSEETLKSEGNIEGSPHQQRKFKNRTPQSSAAGSQDMRDGERGGDDKELDEKQKKKLQIQKQLQQQQAQQQKKLQQEKQQKQKQKEQISHLMKHESTDEKKNLTQFHKRDFKSIGSQALLDQQQQGEQGQKKDGSNKLDIHSKQLSFLIDTNEEVDQKVQDRENKGQAFMGAIKKQIEQQKELKKQQDSKNQKSKEKEEIPIITIQKDYSKYMPDNALQAIEEENESQLNTTTEKDSSALSDSGFSNSQNITNSFIQPLNTQKKENNNNNNNNNNSSILNVNSGLNSQSLKKLVGQQSQQQKKSSPNLNTSMTSNQSHFVSHGGGSKSSGYVFPAKNQINIEQYLKKQSTKSFSKLKSITDGINLGVGGNTGNLESSMLLLDDDPVVNMEGQYIGQEELQQIVQEYKEDFEGKSYHPLQETKKIREKRENFLKQNKLVNQRQIHDLALYQSIKEQEKKQEKEKEKEKDGLIVKNLGSSQQISSSKSIKIPQRMMSPDQGGKKLLTPLVSSNQLTTASSLSPQRKNRKIVPPLFAQTNSKIKEKQQVKTVPVLWYSGKDGEEKDMKVKQFLSQKDNNFNNNNVKKQELVIGQQRSASPIQNNRYSNNNNIKKGMKSLSPTPINLQMKAIPFPGMEKSQAEKGLSLTQTFSKQDLSPKKTGMTTTSLQHLESLARPKTSHVVAGKVKHNYLPNLGKYRAEIANMRAIPFSFSSNYQKKEIKNELTVFEEKKESYSRRLEFSKLQLEPLKKKQEKVNRIVKKQEIMHKLYFYDSRLQLQNLDLREFRDNFTHYRIQSALAGLVKKVPNLKLEIDQEGKIKDGFQYFKDKAQEEMKELQQKAVLREMEQMALECILNKLALTHTNRNFIHESEDLKLRFIQTNIQFINQIQEYLIRCYFNIKNPNLVEDNILQQEEEKTEKVKQIQQEQLEEKYVQRVHDILRDIMVNVKEDHEEQYRCLEDIVYKIFRRHFKKINVNTLIEELLQIKPVLKSQQSIKPVNIEENIEEYQKNQKKQQFLILNTPMFLKSQFESSMLKYHNLDADYEFGGNKNYEHYHKNQRFDLEDPPNKFNLRQKLGILQPQGTTQVMKYKQIFNEMKSNILYEKFDTQTEQNQFKKIAFQQLEYTQHIFLYLRVIEIVEDWYRQKEAKNIYRALKKEVADIYEIYRNYVCRYEPYLDYGLEVDHIKKMTRFLGILPWVEPDLVWIAYLYCMFLIKYSPEKDSQFLDLVLEKKVICQDYNFFFAKILEFQRIKREFMMMVLNQKTKPEYMNDTAWLKFYDKKTDQFYYYNFFSGKEEWEGLKRMTKFRREKWQVMERLCFIEIMDGMAMMIQNRSNIDENLTKIQMEFMEQWQDMENFTFELPSNSLSSTTQFHIQQFIKPTQQEKDDLKSSQNSTNLKPMYNNKNNQKDKNDIKKENGSPQKAVVQKEERKPFLPVKQAKKVKNNNNNEKLSPSKKKGKKK